MKSGRALLDSGAVMLPRAPLAAGSAKVEDLDGELLTLCSEYLELEAKQRRLTLAADGRGHAAEEARAALEALNEVYVGALDRIAELPARTPEGLRAKALAVHAFYRDTEPPGEGDIGGAALWSLVCDVAGRSA